MLGSRLVSTIGGARVSGIIVETEAYGGPEDPASHAATKAGITDRNRVMFGPAGRAYVYRSYGVHWCLNVVTGRDGEGEAVLLRGVSPVEGVDTMRERRGRPPWAEGPGRLAQAFGVTEAHYGHRFDADPLWIERGSSLGEERVGVSPRIGITVAAAWPNRFYVVDAEGVSRTPRTPAQPNSR